MRVVRKEIQHGEGLYLYLLLVFYADPKVTGVHGAIRTNYKLSQFQLSLSRFQHAWVDKAQVWDAPKFFAVVFDCFLNLHAQGCARVIVEP